MKVHISTNFLEIFRLCKDTLGFEGVSDRQTDRQTASPEADKTHNMSVSLKSNTGSTFPEASLPGRRARISLPSSPSRALGRDPEDSVLWLRPIPPREAPPLPAPWLPMATDAGQPPPSGGGKPGPPQPPPPALLPSLPPSHPPSLSPALARCCSRSPPAGNLFWTKSRYLRKKKGRTSGVEKEERPVTAFIFPALSPGQLGSHVLASASPAEVCRACCLAHADRRAPRPACGTLWAAAPGSPNTTQTSRSFLHIPHPAARRAAGLCPEPAPLDPAKVHTQSTLSVLSRPARTPFPAKAPAGPHSGCRPTPGCKPPPEHGTRTKPVP